MKQSSLFSASDPPTDDVARLFDDSALRALEREGYCVIAGVLSERQLEALRHRLDEQAAGEQTVRVATPDLKPGQLVQEFMRSGAIVDVDSGSFEQGGRRDQRVTGLLNKGAIFRELVVHPLAKTVMSAMLGSPYLLSTCSANIARTPKSEQPLHSDLYGIPSPHSDFLLGLNLLWLLDDYTKDNGATTVVPGTHLHHQRNTVAQADASGARPVIASAGSALIYDNRLLHGAGPNRTDRPRRAIISSYTRFFLRQIENYSLSLSSQVLEEADADLRDVIGFRVHSIFGMVGGHMGRSGSAYATAVGAESRGFGGIFVDRPNAPTGPLTADGRPLPPKL